MTRLQSVFFGCFLVIAAAATGCAAPTEPSDTIDTKSSGLTFDTRTADHVAGHFTHEGAVLVFDFQRRAASREATLTSEAGAPLVRATLSADGVETLLLFGGRATVSGARRDAEPTIEGDRDALAELSSMRESKLIEPMRDALQKAGVSAELVAPARDAGLSSKASMNVTYWLLKDSYICFPTWSFWYPTNVFMRHATMMPYFQYQYQRDEWLRTVGNARITLSSGWNFEIIDIPYTESRAVSRSYWGIQMCAGTNFWPGTQATIRVY